MTAGGATIGTDGVRPVRARLGRVVFGLGIVALALVALAWHDLDAGQAVPKDLPGRAVLAWVAAAVMLVAGAAQLRTFVIRQNS